MMSVTNRLSPIERRTVAHWQRVPDENVVARHMASAKFKLNDLGHQGGVGLRAVYLSGPPGVGKTHSIAEQERLWQSRGIRCLRFRPRHVHDLLDYFAEANGRSPLIMEEADIIFRSKPMFEILKQATDPITPDTYTLFKKIAGEKVAVTISLNVPIIVSTNMDLLSDIGWNKELLVDRDALFDRSRPIVVPNDPFALWEWSVYLALSSHLTRDFSIRNPNGGAALLQANPLSVQAQVLDWFTDNLNSLAVISPRTLKRAAEFMGRANRGDMPALILEQELNGLLGAKRSIPVATPAKVNWAELLRTMPKQSSAGMKMAA